MNVMILGIPDESKGEGAAKEAIMTATDIQRAAERAALVARVKSGGARPGDLLKYLELSGFVRTTPIEDSEPNEAAGTSAADESTTCPDWDEKASSEPQRFSIPVFSKLGMELVDIVNVLRGLNTPEDRIQEIITRRV